MLSGDALSQADNIFSVYTYDRALFLHAAKLCVYLSWIKMSIHTSFQSQLLE